VRAAKCGGGRNVPGYCSFLVRYWPRDDGARFLIEQIQTGDRALVSTPREAADWISQQAAAQPSRAQEAPTPTSTTAAPSADARNPEVPTG
jgi:hypothetical protein